MRCVLSLLFFLHLTARATLAQTPTLVRGPYLQVVTPTSVTIRWRTSQPTTGRVWSGPTASQLTTSQRETQPTLEHSLTLTGLQPATRYAYAIGYDETMLTSGSDYYVQTASPAGNTRPFRMWVLGDFGFGNDNQKAVYQAFRNATTTRPADLWLWLGDNAYCCGTDDQFQRYVFDIYGPTLRNTPFYPSPGNHDYADSRTNFDIAYYKLFSVPTKAEAGGVASNSPAYFSANYGNVHIISLDSQAQQPEDNKRLYDTTSVQVQWLKRDLAANRTSAQRMPWTIVIFHHPPYSKGSHDSDTEEQMRLIRENLTPILEREGVDMVMNGHSHDYERYYRLKGQTGLANTFDKAKHVAENTTARYDGSANSCPILTTGQGTVYVVNGSGGAQGGVSPGYPHPGMVMGYRGDTWGGSMVLDMNDNRLDAQFIAYDGSIQDKFTIMKNVNKTASLTAKVGDTLQLAASWPGTTGEYSWTGSPVATNQTGRTIRYVADKAGTFPVTVSDTRQCLTDQFTITVPQLITETEPFAGGYLQIYPNPAKDVVYVTLSTSQKKETSLRLHDAQGKLVFQKKFGSPTLVQEPIPLPDTPGTYLLTVQVGQQSVTRKVVRD